jgi:hypothetical protein
MQQSTYEPAVLTPDSALPEVPAHPAPWTLRAEAYVVALLMPNDLLDTAAFVPDALVPARRGRTSVMLLINYKQAVCGPYQELLFSPAAFATAAGTHPSITRIFVSSQDSVVNGRRNWGIPKDLADFKREARGAVDHFELSRDGHTFAELDMRGYGPVLPVASWLLPAGLRTLVQHWNGKRHRFTLRASGRAQLAKIESWRFDPSYFPDLSRGRVLTASYLPDFEMHFPEPAVEPYLSP